MAAGRGTTTRRIREERQALDESDAVRAAVFSKNGQPARAAYDGHMVTKKKSGAGVVTHRGRMVENLHVETARRLIATDEAIRARG